ncbi:hypothetical protein FVEG_01538 [Fusarium verticillioides 7600]|uniref:Peptidase S1 domain-containing protein n=1 Tax=Gibberella moniliformis (strain M3125 / FGSC 7600) TaxID=334819 RepID=W7LS00_GIBM7|nr:hypothetical protein FVEG_01538 [Fusarium verticillioides 7600]EWG38280.1 hypothetical protein FVEG_01538 [Fusarium verticillioides 7600]
MDKQGRNPGVQQLGLSIGSPSKPGRGTLLPRRDPVPVQIGWKRYGWPELRQLPLKTITTQMPPHVAQLEPDIINQTLSVLKQCKIVQDTTDESLEAQKIEVGLELRQKPFDPESARPTIVLLVPWSAERHLKLLEAAEVMASWLTEFTSHLPDKIYLEIVSPELLQTIYYDEVGDPALSNQWDYVSDKLEVGLRFQPAFRDHLTCLSLQRYGVNPNLKQNPPTIYIGLDDDSKEYTWYLIMNQVEATMAEVGWRGVHIHIERSENFSPTFPLLPLAGPDVQARIDAGKLANKRIIGNYSDTLHIGADFGAAKYLERPDKDTQGKPSSEETRVNPGNGTLGCFIQIKTKNNPVWRTCALTNYHVVRPAFDGFTLVPDPKEKGYMPGPPLEGSDLLKVDKFGFSPNMVPDGMVKENKVLEKVLDAAPVHFESPSRTKHNFTVALTDIDLREKKQREERARVRLQSTQDGPQKPIATRNFEAVKQEIEALETDVRQKKAFFDEGREKVGTLLLAAGFQRKVDGRRMDWALILLDEHRPWSHDLPTGEVWASKYDDPAAHPDETFGYPLTEQMRSIEGTNGVGRAFKVGSTTGPTVGKFWGVKDRVTLQEDKYLGKGNRLETKERIFAGDTFFVRGQPGVKGQPGKFCAKGDSGSAVFDELGGIVGLVFRGHKHRESYDDGYGYVTPIEHVLEDIVAFSKGNITEIRIAQQ